MMGVNIQCASYDDFKAVLGGLPGKIGVVYYRFVSGAGFFAVGMTADFRSAVGVAQSTLPSTFSTDYPNAIQLADSALAVGAGSNFFVT